MKRGFTLIELLAVIVILAIIALIATPIVLNIINDTKQSSTLRSAEFYLNAVEQSIMLERMNTNGSFKPYECEIQLDGNLLCDSNVTLVVDVNGEKPTSGKITFDDGKIDDIIINLSGKDITTNSKGQLVIGDKNIEVILEPGLYDENDELLLSWEELVEEYDFENKIETGGYYDVEVQGLAAVVIDSIEGASKLVIDKSVESIGEHVFEWCISLTSIIIEEGVGNIGNSAFYHCESLTSITIPNSVTSIGESAFFGCSSLTSINIPSGVESIGDYAFAQTILTSITIPSSVDSIGSSTFMACNDLTTINYNGTIEGFPWGAPNIISE